MSGILIFNGFTYWTISIHDSQIGLYYQLYLVFEQGINDDASYSLPKH